MNLFLDYCLLSIAVSYQIAVSKGDARDYHFPLRFPLIVYFVNETKCD